MDTFEDPLEGIPFETLIVAKRIGGAMNLGDVVMGNFETIIPINKNSPFSRLNQIVSIQKSHYVTCWFNAKYESMAMWDLYSNENGIAIKVKFQDLMKYLKPSIPGQNLVEYFCGKVSYQNLRPGDPYDPDTLKKLKRIALRKDDSYSHEKEIRFVVKSNKSEESGLFSEKLPLTKMDIEIIPHPRMAKWKINNVLTLLKSKRLGKRLRSSEIRLR